MRPIAKITVCIMSVIMLFLFSFEVFADATNIVEYSVTVRYNGKGQVAVIEDFDLMEEKLVTSGQSFYYEMGKNIVFKCFPDYYYEVADVEINGESIGNPIQFTVGNLSRDVIIEISFSIGDFEKLAIYNLQYWGKSEFWNTTKCMEDVIEEAYNSYNLIDKLGMVARDLLTNGISHAFQGVTELLEGTSDLIDLSVEAKNNFINSVADYIENALDVLPEDRRWLLDEIYSGVGEVVNFISDVYDELAKGFNSLVGVFSNHFPSYTDILSDDITDEFISNYLYLIDDGYDKETYIEINDTKESLEEISKQLKNYSKIQGMSKETMKGIFYLAFSEDYHEYISGAIDAGYNISDEVSSVSTNILSFEEKIFEYTLLNCIDRQVLEALLETTSNSDYTRYLKKGLERRINKMKKKPQTNAIIDFIDSYAQKKANKAIKTWIVEEIQMGALGSKITSINLVYDAIVIGFKLFESGYNVTTLDDYYKARVTKEIAGEYRSKIYSAMNYNNEDYLNNFSFLLDCYIAAEKTYINKASKIISKAKKEINQIGEETVYQYINETLEYKFAVYNAWIKSSAFSCKTYLDQLIEYAVAIDNGEDVGYKPQSYFTYNIDVTDNVVFERDSFELTGKPKVYFYSNIGLNLSLTDDKTVDITSYCANVGISSLTTNDKVLTIIGNLDSLCSFSGRLIINNDWILSKSITNLNDNSELIVNGDLIHHNGVIDVGNGKLTVHGDYLGYDEDDEGKILEGGSLYINNFGYVKISGNSYFYSIEYYKSRNRVYQGSYTSVGSVLRYGTLELQGDLVNLSPEYSFSNGDANYRTKIIFSGNETQHIISLENQGVYLGDVTVSNNRGVDCSQAVNIGLSLKSDINLYGNYFKGSITLNGYKIHFMDNDVLLDRDSYINLRGGSLEAEGNLTTYADITFHNLYDEKYGSIIIKNNLKHPCGVINVGNGKLTIHGDYLGYDEDNDGNILEGGNLEINSSGYIKILGNCYFNSIEYYKSNRHTYSGGTGSVLRYGTLELQGDLVNLSPEYNFYNGDANYSCKLLFSGKRIQKVCSAPNKSFVLRNVSISNPSGVDFFDSGSVSLSLNNSDYYNIKYGSNNKIDFVKPKIKTHSITVPNRLTYYIDESFDPTGGKLKLTYYNGVTTTIDITDEMISGYDKSELGAQTITVTYEGFTDTFDITVVGGKIVGANLAIGSSLTINFYATLTEGFENSVIRFTRNGNVTVVEGVYDETRDAYKYAYTGINPQCMADNVKAELMFDGEVIYTVESYSVKAYCDRVAAKTAAENGMSEEKYAKFRTLIADMLEYGAKAQMFMRYNIENLANSGEWVEECRTQGFNAPQSARTITGAGTDMNKFVSAGLELSNVNKIFFKFIAEEGATLTLMRGDEVINEFYISELTAENGRYAIYTDGIYATGFDDVYTAILKNSDGNEVQRMSYTTNSYVANMHATSVGYLIKSMYNYGASANAYMAA